MLLGLHVFDDSANSRQASLTPEARAAETAQLSLLKSAVAMEVADRICCVGPRLSPSMNISINITADSTSDRDLMDRLLGALARIPDMTTAKAVVVRQPDLPAGHPQAVPMQKVESVPAPPLDEDTKTKLAALTAKHEAAPPVEEPKRGPGRPKGSKNKPPAWEPPVPRPEGGVYGKQTAPPDDPAWQAFRDSIRDRMRVVVFTASLTGVGGKKWVASMLDRYGDGEAGKLGCVPQGNLQAMIEEAEAGPKERPFTKEELEAGRLELERQAKQPAGATP